MASSAIRHIAPGLHVAEAQQTFFGLQVGARMTVLELAGGLLIHSPIAVDPETITPLGTPRWVLAPNLFHHLYVGPWIKAGLEAWAARGVAEKRPDLSFRGVIEANASPFGEDVSLLPLSCFPFTNEIVVLHRPSRTLIITDLCFNISASAPWSTRFVMRSLGGYPGVRTTVVERWGLRREEARRELGVITSWDFDRLILAHGEIVETAGKDALVEAFRWLDGG